MPFFSIVISTKNRSNLISKAIQSVLDQSFSDFELIIIDNASTDNTEEIIRSFEDSRISFYKNEVDMERCFARNRGISLSNGNYICFLDSDDQYLPNHLQVLYDRISVSFQKALFFTNAYETYNFNDKIERICPDLEDFELFDYILTYTFNPARVAIHTDILKKYKYDEKIPGLEDLDLWLRIATEHPIIQIKQRTILYNLHDESYSLSAPNRFERELSLFKYVFGKEELKNKLSKRSRNRLISMCHYKIAMSMSSKFRPFIVHWHIILAFLLYPSGYNSNSNRTMFFIFCDQIPFLGFVFKKLRRIVKLKF
jgi:glycosyltransferase involved in cell wall biosynthesis